MLNVCVAGASGWVGRSLVPAILGTEDLHFSGAVSRSLAGRSLREALGFDSDLVVRATVGEALSGASVLVDFTSANVVLQNVLTAIERRVNVVIGTSGLTEEDFANIHNRASAATVGVLAAGNFALTAVLLQHFAVMAAKFIPSWEIVDYAHDDKLDAPSGTARELAYRLSQVRSPRLEVPLDRMVGMREARGATLGATQVHSVRLPGFVIGVEAIFGQRDERLHLRHESGSGPTPYIAGTLLAIREVARLQGLHRGFDTVMEF